MRFECTGVVPIDLNELQIGDYANIFNGGWNTNNKGSFEITNVEVYYVTGTLHQAFEFINLIGVAETVLQNSNDELQFFRPFINTTQSSNGRTIVVSSTTDQQLDIVIPATTQAVNREEKTGAYLHDNDAINVYRISRDKTGEVTVFYNGSPAPTPAVGQHFFLDNINPTPPETFKNPGAVTAFPGTSTTDAANQDLVQILQLNTTQEDGRNNFDVITALNGDGLIIGGSTLVAGVPTSSSRISRYHQVSSATVSDGTLADGAKRYTYQWLNPSGTTTNATEYNRVANITVGPAIGQVMINGGANITLGNYSTTSVVFGSSRKYDPTTNTTTVSGSDPAPFCGHTLTTLPDGRILSYGGGDCIGNSLSGRNSNAGYIWNPGTQAWPSVGVNDFATTYRRAFHTTSLLTNGKVLFCGGLAGAEEWAVDSKTLAYWKLNELAGTSLADSSSNSYTLTTSGTTAGVQAAKIDSGREFTQLNAHAAGAGNAGAVTALLGDWTVEWWSCGVSGVYPGAMTLAGLGSGTVIAYGTVADETANGNTLMHVGITGGNLFFRWENGAGVDVTGSRAITGHINGHYNHYAVRKKLNGATYDVSMFVNGHQIGATFTGLANASGGSSSQWYMARDPDGSIGFNGVLDSVVVSKNARSDEDILLDYWNGSPSLPTNAGPRQHRLGKCWEKCELFDPSGPSVSIVASMGLARAAHSATVLPDGRVIVIGGLSHDPTNFTKELFDAGPTTGLGCSNTTNTSEIYDPVANKWVIGPRFNVRRCEHSALYISSRNVIIVIGGISTQGDDAKIIEVLDLNTMQVGVYAEKLTYQGLYSTIINDNTILVGTNESDGAGGYRKQHQLLTLEDSKFGSTQIGDYHKITAIGSGFFKYQTPNAKHIYSNYGKPNKSNVPAYTVTTGSRTTNVTTLTLAAQHSFAVGDLVYANLISTVAFGSGVKTITVVTDTTISYAETASDQAPVSIGGEIFKNYAPDATVSISAAQQNSVVGPYVLDPIEGVAITDIESSIGGSLYTGIYKDLMYTVLPVVDATVFPDKEGFIVLGFGTDKQTQPIRYYGHYNPEGLLIDYRYKFLDDMPSGTDVTLLSQRDPYLPKELIGQLYITSSAAGRVAAEKTVNDIAAAGVDIDVTIVYPGDRGLGAEGYPVNSTAKLSDKVMVWGGDDLDNEIKGLKE